MTFQRQAWNSSPQSCLLRGAVRAGREGTRHRVGAEGLREAVILLVSSSQRQEGCMEQVSVSTVMASMTTSALRDAQQAKRLVRSCLLTELCNILGRK